MMTTSRRFAILVAVFFLTVAQPTRADDKILLQEKITAGDQWRIHLDMQLTGKLLLKSGEKIINLELSAQAKHQFPERVLGLDQEGLPVRMGRYYDQASAVITVHGVKQTRSLRPERRVQIAQRLKEATVTYAPSGPLTREELELTGDHLDVLAIHCLLPAKHVGIGDKWDVPVPAAQGLTAVEGVVTHNLVCQLEQIKDGLACITITGTVEGIAHGAEVKSVVEGYLWFDVDAQRWSSMRWKQTDDRANGPASPGSKTETNTTVVRSFRAPAEQLSDAVANSLPAEPSAGHLLLCYKDAKSRHEFLYERGWLTVSQTDQYTVLRLLDRGELIGELNITPHAQARPGEHLSPDEFQKHVQDIPNFRVDQVLQTGEVPAEPGHWIYRVSGVGRASDLDVLQNHYLVAGPKGDQVILTFTTEVPLAERLGGKDLSIVATMTFPEN